ncbi:MULTISPECIES: hypothetical protein [unclassified Pseudocitrobacter]|uniref:hypothetical protein n=1 Tax=unclassified Pseudocitrobacter TaxID=2638778 RepID=UPI0023E3BF1A|nr:MULTISPECIES: hypothetical protein [unclassified Pseudocitrobacter]MDF3827670.1 hypothetical protein [Pseudocitrobacter sp. 2023EL-00150]MEC5374070.1 hypothetical protein [Pseudocitrobacter sp. MW920760]
MSGLEQYYSGDNDWAALSKLYEKYQGLEDVVKLSNEFNGDLALSSVIYGKVGKYYYLKWIERKIPALNDLSPLDCNDDLILNIRLKEMLMRMP